MAFQETEEFKRLYKTERYKIEAKNAELKNVLGYARAESYGMDAMQMQGAITMFAANVKRIIKLLEEAKKEEIPLHLHPKSPYATIMERI